MAIAFVQSRATSAGTSSTTLTLAFTGAVSPGNMLFAAVLSNQATSTAVSDSVNGAWTAIGTAPLSGSGSNSGWSMGCYRFFNTAAGTPTVTYTCGTTCTFRAIAIGEYSGVASIENSSYANTGLVASPASTPSLTPAASTDAAIGIIVPNNSVTGITAPYNTREITGFANCGYGDNLSLSAGVSTSMSATLNSNSDNMTSLIILAATVPSTVARRPFVVNQAVQRSVNF